MTPAVMGYLLVLLASAGGSAGRAGQELTVDADFPGGSGIVQKIDGDSIVVRCDSRDCDWNLYWYFRVRGAAGRTLTVELAKSWGFGALGPAASLDEGKTWRWVGRQAVTGRRFTYAVPDDAREVRFCVSIPYAEANLKAFLARHKGSAALRREVLCRTRAGREVDLLYAGRLDGKAPAAVSVTCRHHACEMMAGYVLEGLLAAVLADAEDGRWFRRNVELLAVPFVDKDGVEAGDQGKNRRPHDHNRDYEGRPIYPAVQAIKQLLPKWSRGRLRFAMDIHCPTLGDRNIFFVEGFDEGNSVALRPFTEILEKVRTGPLKYESRSTLRFGRSWNRNRDRRSHSRWVATLPDAPVVAALEVPYAVAGGVPVTAEGARAFGADLAAALCAFLKQAPATIPASGPARRATARQTLPMDALARGVLRELP